jgi:hypothetical protein
VRRPAPARITSIQPGLIRRRGALRHSRESVALPPDASETSTPSPVQDACHDKAASTRPFHLCPRGADTRRHARLAGRLARSLRGGGTGPQPHRGSPTATDAQPARRAPAHQPAARAACARRPPAGPAAAACTDEPGLRSSRHARWRRRSASAVSRQAGTDEADPFGDRPFGPAAAMRPAPNFDGATACRDSPVPGAADRSAATSHAGSPRRGSRSRPGCRRKAPGRAAAVRAAARHRSAPPPPPR